MSEAIDSTDLKRAALQEYYQTIQDFLGEPSETQIPYPIPDYVQPNTIGPTQSIHSPYFLLIDHQDLGLYPSSFHQYNAPARLGEGKVILQLRKPIEKYNRGSILVIEGLVANSPKGVIASYCLYTDGYQYSAIRYSLWEGHGNLVLYNQANQHYRIETAPDGIWEKAAQEIKRHQLIPDERLLMIKPPLRRPLTVRGDRPS